MRLDITKIIDRNTGFNPRICKRCDDLEVASFNKQNVSIHASVKDATIMDISLFIASRVSIHASVKDAT